jgi:hypothetical protein
VPRRGAILRRGTAATAAASLLLASGCGGDARQDAADHDATYRVTVPHATFPARQSLATTTELRIAVHNDDGRTIPNLAATITAGVGGTSIAAFGEESPVSGQASSSRPVWIVDDGPADGDTAYANTWAIGPLAAGQTKTFVWRVTAVVPGTYSVRYALFGSLAGKSKLQLKSGATPHGTFRVRVSGRPAQTKVTPGGRILSVAGN